MFALLRRPFIAVFACVVALGCAQETEIVAAQPTFPTTPDGTIQAVAQSLAENHPEIFWEALPESYRTDINGLTAGFAAKMDPELYDRSMALALKFVDVIQAKQGIILASETVQNTGVDVAAIEARMTPTLAVVRTFFGSEISTLAGLAAIDWQAYLAGTGGQLMTQAEAIPAVEGKDPFAMLDTLQVEVLEETGDTAHLKVTANGEDPEEVNLTRVENRWVPSEMAEQWQSRVAEAQARLDELTPEKVQELKGQAMFGLAMAEGFVTQLSTIETSEEFDATVGPMLQGLMGNMQGMMPEEAGEGDSESVVEEPAPATETPE
jgi:hypothetical protein